MNEDFEHIYDENYSKIYNYVYYRLLNKESTEDAVSEIFFKALENIHGFDAKRASVSTWLFKIASNTVNDYFRKTKKSVHISIEYAELSDGDMVCENIIADEDTQKLYECLKALDDRMRTVIALRYWGGLSYAEIAEQTGITEKNAGVILSRAIVKLRKLFEK